MNATRIGGDPRQRLYASTTATYDETADLDLIAVEYALNGEPVALTTAERIHAARLLAGRGLTTGAIAHQLGTSTDTIRGWQANGWKRRSPRKTSA